MRRCAAAGIRAAVRRDGCPLSLFGKAGPGLLVLYPLALMLQRLELRHQAAVALGEKRVLAPGIFPLADGHTLKKALPQRAVEQLFTLGQDGLIVLHMGDARAPVCIQQQFLVCAIEDEKLLVGVSLAKMSPQQRQHAVFRCDLRPKCTAVIRKTHKAPQLLQLTIHVANGAVQGITGRVGKIAHEARALRQKLPDEGI